MPGFGILAAVLGIVMAMNSVGDGASAAEISEKVGAAMVGTFIGIFFCYGLLEPLANMMKQLVNSEASTMETVKVVLCTHVAGKPALLAIDAGRRLIQLNTKPSFAQLELWINAMGGEDESQNKRRRTSDRMTG
jgi:chemotaxis protein MotA